ncbi:haloacid dehalogenase [Fulvitalea axinellae]|uniref:Haloacid dehalogenase n=1 Tax=Fulvitalea axinellae TaxID=1182444 RepID=A0AAU9CTJ8_9BACT|nr:haloacid dehalogenase [Fulvitalea axinellae]
MEKKTIAAFDFDLTLTDKDTLWEFLVFAFGKRKVLTGLAYCAPDLIGMKMGLRNNGQTKEKLIGYFTKGMSERVFTTACEDFTRNRLPSIIRRKALNKLLWHQDKGHEPVIVSASPENWIRPWASQYSVEVIGTKLLTSNGTHSGLFASKNCSGKEKVRRLLEFFPERENYTLFAYGDSSGDKDLLAFADYPFYRRF